MRRLFLLVALTCLGLSVVFSGPVLSLPLIVSMGLLVAALVYLFAGAQQEEDVAWIVVDGSNVMYWDGETPSLETVRRVLDAIHDAGFVPLVWFDANAGYLLTGRYLTPWRLAGVLNIDHRQISVAPKGTPADPLLLEQAREMGARVVTNDRFRDWVDDHPFVREPGILVRGRASDGVVSLALNEALAARS